MRFVFPICPSLKSGVSPTIKVKCRQESRTLDFHMHGKEGNSAEGVVGGGSRNEDLERTHIMC